MIAAPLGPPLRMAVVAAPSYFERHPVPQMPQDLTSHNCINIRLPTYGGQSVSEFDKDRREMRVRVEGQLVINNAPLRLASVCDGLGIPARSVMASAGASRRAWVGGARFSATRVRRTGSPFRASRCSRE